MSIYWLLQGFSRPVVFTLGQPFLWKDWAFAKKPVKEESTQFVFSVGTRRSSDTNAGSSVWQCRLTPTLGQRGGPWNSVQALLTKHFALAWNCISRDKGLSFSNWHEVTTWVSSSPFQTLGFSALWPSFQGLSSPFPFQSVGICLNKYLLGTYFVSGTGFPTLMNLIVYWRLFHLSFFMATGELSSGEAWADLSPCFLGHELISALVFWGMICWHLTWKAHLRVEK